VRRSHLLRLPNAPKNLATRVFSWDSSPLVDAPIYKLSCARAETMVTDGEAVFTTLSDGRRALQLLPTKAQLEDKRCDSVGRNNLIPFGRVWDKLRQPNRINYPIPAVGARNRPQ
jgi:hypothetical protein